MADLPQPADVHPVLARVGTEWRVLPSAEAKAGGGNAPVHSPCCAGISRNARAWRARGAPSRAGKAGHKK
ncbi:hypothetical protein GCM10010266_31970 [Streptomyces griseomycini]|uniref:hypothetical protein n=1 Tax=Streptomyces griseomycini TaxID=66895 RepID=UPI00198E396D|nr:hypothetical protein GCM10010266_31970 [Streptomyces griseomycini]GGR21440.1 hypothetical protein GCM10015536_28910 [Streptomyces griseomycini]